MQLQKFLKYNTTTSIIDHDARHMVQMEWNLAHFILNLNIIEAILKLSI